MIESNINIVIIANSNQVVNKEFDIWIEVEDVNETTRKDYTGKISFHSSDNNALLPKSYKFSFADKGVRFFNGIKFSQPGIQTVIAKDAQDRIIGKSNPIEVTAQEKEHKIYWGDIHVHSKLGKCGGGTPEENFSFAHDVSRLDFCCLSDHAGDIEHLSPEKWDILKQITQKYYSPGEFVTLLGFEWTNPLGKQVYLMSSEEVKNFRMFGHVNVYYRNMNGNYYSHLAPETDTPAKLFAKLRGQDAIAIPHHPASATFPVNWDHLDDEAVRLVEIYSMWGNSERSKKDGNLHPIRRGSPKLKGEVAESGHFVQDALARGYRLGIIAGSDGHDSRAGHTLHHLGEDSPMREIYDAGSGCYPNGLAAVYARELTRESIFNSLKERRCYGTTGARIVLDFQVNGQNMGREIQLSESMRDRTINVRVAGTEKIERIEIVRNNTEIYTYKGKCEIEEFEWTDKDDLFEISLSTPGHYPFTYYYVRVTQSDSQMAWSSPIWVGRK